MAWKGSLLDYSSPKAEKPKERASDEAPASGGDPIDREANPSLDLDPLVDETALLTPRILRLAPKGTADPREKLLCLLIEPTCLASL